MNHDKQAKPWSTDLDTVAKGAIAEAKVRARATELGIVIAEVVGHARYDYVIEQ